MITTELQVDDYCQSCHMFTPEIAHKTLRDGFGEIHVHRVKIYCKNAAMCQQITRMLEAKYAKEDTDAISG